MWMCDIVPYAPQISDGFAKVLGIDVVVTEVVIVA